MTKRVLFLISDTGGGHRAGAQAVGAALDEIDGATRFEWRIDDIATHCTFPLSALGPAYSAALRYAPPIYGALYHATNGRRRYKTIVRFCEPLYRERLREVFTQYQPDVIVSVHPLLNHAALRARADAGMQQVPIVTVITDLGRVHEGWLLPEADLTVVPAREVYQRAIERGVPPERLRLLGHPIHPRFEDVSGSKAEIRKKLGLPGEGDDRAADGGRRGRRQAAPDDAGPGQGRPRLPPRRRHRPQRRAQSEARGAGAVAAHADDGARLPQRRPRADARRRPAGHQGRSRHDRRGVRRRGAGRGVRLRPGPGARQPRLRAHQRDRRRRADDGRGGVVGRADRAQPGAPRQDALAAERRSRRAAARAGSPS